MITASILGESLVIDDHMVAGCDLIDLLHLGRTVPVYSLGEQSGWMWNQGNLMHLELNGSRFVMARKCLMSMLKHADITAIRVQAVTA